MQLNEPKIRELFELRALYIDGSRVVENQDLTEGQVLRVHVEPRRFALPAEPAQLIAFENDEFLIADKPAGLPVHPTLDNALENLWTMLANERRVYPTHRLDVPTSGLLVFAKSTAKQAFFNSLFKNRLVEKIYVADTEGRGLVTGLVRHWMEPGDRAPRKVRRENFEGGRECALEITSVEPNKNGERVTIRLLTGRTHQIRAQLADLGHPILNDMMYGAVKISDDDAIALRACRLAWPSIDGHASFEFESYKDTLVAMPTLLSSGRP